MEAKEVKNGFIVLLFAMVALNGITQGLVLAQQNGSATSDEKTPAYLKNITVPTQKEKVEPKVLTEFKAKYGKPSIVEWNVHTGALKRIRSLNYDTGEGDVKSAEKAERIAEKFIEDNKALWKVDVDDLKTWNIEYSNRTRRWIVSYQQHYQGVPVELSFVGVTITDKGKIYSASSGFHPNISISTTPTMSEGDAIEIAKAKLALENYTRMGNASLIIMPQKDGEEINYRLAYMVPLQFYKFFIDAQSGEIIKYYSILTGADVRFHGTVTGQVLPKKPSDTPVPWNFKDQYVYTKDDDPLSPDDLMALNITDASGYYDTGWMSNLKDPPPDEEAEIYIYAQLKGPHVFVRTLPLIPSHDVEHRYDYGKVSGEFTHNWDWGLGDETTVYYQVTRAHDYFTETPFYYDTMTYQMEVKLNSPVAEPPLGKGASSDGTDIYISGNDQWANSSDVIIHEYTHNVINHIYGGYMISQVDDNIESRAMDEGITDYFAGTLNNNSYMTEDLPVNRELNNNFQYQDLGTGDFDGDGDIDRYDDSLIISGALWDLRGYAGQSVADDLIFHAMKEPEPAEKPIDFSTFFNSILEIDDDPAMGYGGNDDPSDGTPHSPDIWQAFADHGMDYDTTGPSAPSLYSPSGPIGTNTPIFSWNPATDDLSGINYYRIQVDNDINFLSPEIDASPVYVTSYIDPSPLGDTTFYWRVWARDEAGNWGSYSSTWSFTVETTTPLPDLTLTSSDITWDSASSQITATIHNTGDAGASNVLVEFFNGAPANNDLIGSQTITSIAAGGSQDAVVTWNNAPEGTQTVYVVIDSAHLGSGAILEGDETNNIESKQVSVPARATYVSAITLTPEEPDIYTTTTITTTITNSGGTINNARLKVLWAGPDREFDILEQCTADFSISSGESNIEKSCNWDFDEHTGQIFIKAELWDWDTFVLVSALEKETYVLDRTYELRFVSFGHYSDYIDVTWWGKSGQGGLIDGARYYTYGKLARMEGSTPFYGDPGGCYDSLMSDCGNWSYLGSILFPSDDPPASNTVRISKTEFDYLPDGMYYFGVVEDLNNNGGLESGEYRDGISSQSYLVNFHILAPAIDSPANNSEVSGIVTIDTSSKTNGIEDEDITKMVFQKYEGGSWTNLSTDNTPENGFSYTEDMTNVPDMTERVIRSEAFAMDSSSATSSSITLIVRSDIKPDLVVYLSSISFDPSQPTEGDVVTIYAQVFNIGSATANDVKVRFYLGDPNVSGTQIGPEQTITSIDAGGNGITSVNWNSVGGSYDIYVVADPLDQIPESDDSNNKASKTVKVNIPPTEPTSLTPVSGIYSGASPISIACSGSTDPNGDPIYYNILGHYDGTWHDLELNGDGIYYWDVSSIPSQTDVDLKCSATDLG